MIIGNAEPIKNQIILLQLLMSGLKFLEPAVDKSSMSRHVLLMRCLCGE